MKGLSSIGLSAHGGKSPDHIGGAMDNAHLAQSRILRRQLHEPHRMQTDPTTRWLVQVIRLVVGERLSGGKPRLNNSTGVLSGFVNPSGYFWRHLGGKCQRVGDGNRQD